MSDADDAVTRAGALNRQLAGRHLARKEELEATLADLAAKRAQMDGMPELPEVTQLRAELDARSASVTGELAEVDAELHAALAEVGELKRLHETEATRTVAVLTAEDDPLIRSPEQVALDNAREHINSLDAQARLGDELAGVSTAAPSPTATPSREDKDAEARAKFEEMRAKLTSPAAPPKKTL